MQDEQPTGTFRNHTKESDSDILGTFNINECEVIRTTHETHSRSNIIYNTDVSTIDFIEILNNDDHNESFVSSNMDNLISHSLPGNLFESLNQDEQPVPIVSTQEIVTFTLKDELRQINSKISTNECVTINAYRNDSVFCIARSIKRSSLKKIDVVFVDLNDTPEGAIDSGGPTRELWRG